ncbi:MAG: right-handed parallel beta-helix repeat-containing protein [Thermoplasmatota archaeon]
MRKILPTLVAIFLLAGTLQVTGLPSVMSVTGQPTRDMWIKGDAALLQTASQWGWTGTGADDDPVLIRDRIIYSQGHSGIILKLEDISLNFKIINITLRNLSYSEPGGIHLINASGDIMDCNVIGADYGVRLTRASNMVVSGGNYSDGFFGIVLENCVNVTVKDNICSGNKDGIDVLMSDDCHVEENELISNTATAASADDSTNISIVRNHVVDNDFGIYLLSNRGSDVRENILLNQDDHHIRIDNSMDIVVEGNTAYGYGDGLSLIYDPNNITVLNNSFIDNMEFGIYVEIGSKDNRFYNNRMVNCSFYMEPDIELIRGQKIALNNTVNGKRIHHHVDVPSLTISGGAGQVILGNVDEARIFNCDLSSQTIGTILSECRDITLSDCDMNGNTYYGFYANGMDRCRISNSTFEDNYEGIRIYMTSMLGILDCRLHGNEVGMDLIGLVHLEMHRNNISENMVGVQNEYWGVPDQHCDISENHFSGNADKALDLRTVSSVVRGNTFAGNAIGVQLDQSTSGIIDAEVFNNSFNGNGIGVDVKAGVISISWNQMKADSVGLQFSTRDAQQSTANGNVILDPLRYGIFLIDCDNVWLTDNVILDAGRYGIEIFGSTNILLAGNELFNCSVHMSGSERKHFAPHQIGPTNTVDSRPLHYFMSKTGLIFDTDIDVDPGQVIIADYDEVVMEDINFRRGTNSLLMAYCEGITVRNCTFADQYISVELYRCENAQLSNCMVAGSSIGIRVVYSSGVLVKESTVTDSSEVAMDLRISSYIHIQNSTIQEGAGDGIDLQNCGVRVEIKWCVITEMENGIHLSSTTSDVEVNQNIFALNRKYAMIIDRTSDDNEICENSFNRNNWTERNGSRTGNDPQVECHSSSSHFNNNYWSGMEGSKIDPERDWIYEEPYWVGPGSNDLDHEPIVYPVYPVLPWPTDPFTRLTDTTSPEPVRLDFEIREGLKNAPVRSVHIVIATPEGTDHRTHPVDEYGEFEFFFERPLRGEELRFEVYTESIAGTSRRVNTTFPDSVIQPTVRILSPQDGSVLNQRIVRIDWEAHSNVGGELIDLRAIINGEEMNFSDTDYNHTSKRMKEGTNTVTIKVTDHFGNSAEDSIEFTVDTVPPSFQILNSGPVNSPVTIRWKFDNIENETLRMWWSQPGLEWVEINPFDLSLILQLRQGPEVVDLMTRDIAGNEFISRIELEVDNLPPHVTSWGPKENEWEQNDRIWIIFSEPMDAGSIDIQIRGMNYSFEIANDTGVLITPLMVLGRDMRFSIVVSGSDIAGNRMDEYHFLFSTGREGTDPAKGDLNILVVDGNGELIRGIRVSIFPLNEVYEDHESAGIVQILDLDPGDYEVEVKAGGYRTKVLSVFVTAGTSRTEVVVLEEDGKDWRISPLLILLASLITVSLVFLAVIFFSRTRIDIDEE